MANTSPDGRRRHPAPTVDVNTYHRLEGLELAVGWVFGHGPRPPATTFDGPRAGLTRCVLEQVLLESLDPGPATVFFSGGRDSSSVLALAAHVARREGLPLPIPFTLRFPGDVDSDESDWQERVLDHLAIRDREVLLITDEHRVLGDAATEGLLQRGVVFPAATQWAAVHLSHLRGHHVLTGEGGDELISRRRGTSLYHLRKAVVAGRLPSRRLLRELPDALRPGWTWRPNRALFPSWLPDDVALAAATRFARDQRQPLRWDRATERLLTYRATAVMRHNLGLVAREHDAVYVHPFSDPRVIRALAAEGGAWGYAGRTDIFRRLFGDLLPDEVLARRTKARFNRTRWGEREREFARAWDGSGVDHELVDVEVLREAWLSPVPPVQAEVLLQAAWLTANGGQPVAQTGVGLSA
jgi:asparagine synthetase B (glutamine-hydrolysing)